MTIVDSTLIFFGYMFGGIPAGILLTGVDGSFDTRPEICVT